MATTVLSVFNLRKTYHLVPIFDGVNHPNDTGGLARRIGTLRFIRTS